MSKLLFVAVIVCLALAVDATSTTRRHLSGMRERARGRSAAQDPTNLTAEKAIFDAKIAPQLQAAIAKIGGTARDERTFYQQTSANIPALVQGAIGLNVANIATMSAADAEKTAKMAYLIRHWLRTNVRAHQAARGFCAKVTVWFLKARDFFVYGNADGPTFAQLVTKFAKGAAPSPATFAAVAGGASRTNTAVNAALGIGGSPPTVPSAFDASATASTIASQTKFTAPAKDEVGPMDKCDTGDRAVAFVVSEAMKKDIKSDSADADGDSSF